MAGIDLLAGGAAAFVASHFALSHPLRRPMVRLMGEVAFMGVYSLVAFVALGAMIFGYHDAPDTAPLWTIGTAIWSLVTVTMLLASILLIGSLIGNPALPDPMGRIAIPSEARGVFAITRHPMMWAFALWGACHILVYPVTRNIIVAVAMIVLALGGAAMQDRKKAALDPVGWPSWVARTSYWPFAAIIAGRARMGGLGLVAWLGGVAFWLAATWVHIPAAGYAAGIWHWMMP